MVPLRLQHTTIVLHNLLQYIVLYIKLELEHVYTYILSLYAFVTHSLAHSIQLGTSN